ncbi:MAG: polyprenyl synthetase family protein [Candidatus Thermoplasmatota archaeon]
MDIKAFLNERKKIVYRELYKALNIGEQMKLKEAMRHLPLAGGKRLRAILPMLVADAISGESKKAIPFGIAMEIIHNFTLIHDDIMDKDIFRRGVPTVHTKFDEPTAINAGDALFARAFEVLCKLKVSDNILRIIIGDVAKMVREIGEGQQWDLDFEKRSDVSINEYLRMIEKKTALMFQICCKGGAIISGGSKKQINSMAKYGKYLGICFQIWDDYLALTSDFKKFGKELGNDIRRGKRTLMVIYSWEKCKEKEKNFLNSILGKENASIDEINAVIELMRNVGAIDFAKNFAESYAEKAKKFLYSLEESKHREALFELVNYMLRREE